MSSAGSLGEGNLSGLSGLQGVAEEGDDLWEAVAQARPPGGELFQVRAFLEELPCLAFLERDGTVLAANLLARRMIGVEAVAAEGLFLGSYPAPGDERRQRFECLALPPHGRPTMVSGAVQPFASAGWTTRLVLVMEPVQSGAGGETTGAFKGRGTYLQDMFDSAQEAMLILQGNRILDANREFVRMFEYPLADCLGADVYDLIVPEGRLYEREIMLHTVATEGRSTIETVRRTRTGEDIDVSVLVTRVRLEGDTLGLSVMYRDIRPQKQAEARLQHAALHDGLTGLANRVLFLDRLELTMARLKRRPDRSFSVVFLDVDHFKQVNDRHGHAAGDTVLLAVTERLRACLRPQDTIARFGGDEFALLLDEACTVEDIDVVAGRIQREIQRPVKVEGAEVFVSASMGVALGSVNYANADDIMQDADKAMYLAKAGGKARHAFFEAGAADGIHL